MSELDDPRVLFASERTLLAWNRTSLALMAFGFVIERFGVLISIFSPQHAGQLKIGISFWVGITFILLGAYVAAAAAIEYRRVLKTLKPIEIPSGYQVNLGVVTNLLVAILGVMLTVYLFVGSTLPGR